MATVQTPITLTSTQYFETAYDKLQKENSTLNRFALPKIEKVCINVGIGKLFDNKQKQQIVEYLINLTGQKPKLITTRKSISGFKVRSGDVVGAILTLRGKKMQDFLFNLIYISLPRTRDFRGIKLASFDSNYSCYSLGIPASSIFPAIGFDADINFGIQINIAFKHSGQTNLGFLKHLSFPFSKITTK